MRLAISNIAWSYEDRIEAYKILYDSGIHGLEIAPKLLFPNIIDNKVNLLDHKAKAAFKELRDFQLELVSMQSLLYGVTDAKLFLDIEKSVIFDETLFSAIKLAGELGVTNLVFGSPDSRRIPNNMTDQEAYGVAIQRFNMLGDFAKINNTIISIEAAPDNHARNFLHDTFEALNFVKRLNHQAVKLNLDLGIVYFLSEYEYIEKLIKDNISLIGHVHVSEPDLAPAPADLSTTKNIFLILKQAGYKKWISLEMKEYSTNSIETLRVSANRLVEAFNLAD